MAEFKDRAIESAQSLSLVFPFPTNPFTHSSSESLEIVKSENPTPIVETSDHSTSLTCRLPSTTNDPPCVSEVSSPLSEKADSPSTMPLVRAQKCTDLVATGFSTAQTLTQPLLVAPPATMIESPADDIEPSSGRPRLAAYCPSFKKAETLIKVVAKNFEDLVQSLKDQGYHNPEIDVICEKIHSWSILEFRYPRVQPVAMLGPSGAGKSSSMNSLLGETSLAIKDDNGERGTYVTHEYHGAEHDQIHRYNVRARYYSSRMVRDRVRKHVEHALGSNHEGEGEDETEGDEIAQKQRTAYEFFHALLCNAKFFCHGHATTDDIEEYFDNAGRAEVEQIVSQLTPLVEAFLSNRTRTNNGEEKWHLNDDTELVSLFKQIARPRKARGGYTEPSPWPLIRSICIHMHNDLLSTNLVLADCPGVSDNNLTVVQNTKDYLRKAGTLLIFHPIERIRSDATLDANLREAIRLGRESDTILVVTKIDEKDRITDKEQLSDTQRDRLEKAEKRVSELRDRKKAILLQRNSTNADTFMTLTLELENINEEIFASEAMIKQVCVQIRNEDLELELRDKFRKLGRSRHQPDLKVIFQSSKEYGKHINFDPNDRPILELEATGVPALKRQLYKIPTVGKSEMVKRIGIKIIPTQLKAVISVLTKPRLERKQEVDERIRYVLGGCVNVIKSLEDGFISLFNEYIEDFMRQQSVKWKEKLKELLDGPAGWVGTIKAMTFLAFCRRGGQWRMKAQHGRPEKVSWNEQIQNCFADDLAQSFDSMYEELEDLIQNTANRARDLFEEVNQALDECEHFQEAKNEDFTELITRIGLEAEEKMRDHLDPIRIDFKEVQSATILDVDRDNFVAQAMDPVYKKCVQISSASCTTAKPRKRAKLDKSGTVTGLRIAEIRAKLLGDGTEEGLIQHVLKLARSEYEENVKTWVANAQKELQESCEDVLENFAQRFQVADVKVEENAEATQTLQDAANEALRILDSEFVTLVEAYEAYGAKG